jgi:hypothetical protein
MNNESILEYYTNNATPEQHRLVNTVYSCDYIKALMDLGFNGRKGLTMDEVYLLFLTINLEKDLDGMQRRLLEISNGDNEETFKEFIDNMEYRYERIVENNGGNVE